MPTYEYACQKCGQNFEAFQSMRAEPFRECPKELCRLPKWGHGKVKRLFGTGAGLIFKGSGFYITDYRSDSYKDAAKTDAGGSAESKSTETKSTDGKPATESKPAAKESKTESKKTPPAKSAKKD